MFKSVLISWLKKLTWLIKTSPVFFFFKELNIYKPLSVSGAALPGLMYPPSGTLLRVLLCLLGHLAQACLAT